MSSKVFIVTGASKGLGAAITQRLLSQSHKVVLAARSEQLLEAVKKSHPGQVEYIAGDLADSSIGEKLVESAIKAFGKVDGVVINHGVVAPKKLADVSLDEFRHVYEVNTFSHLGIAKAALGELRKSKGCIVWVSSGAMNLNLTAWGAYSSSKAAVNIISSHLAGEEPDITTISVEPGLVDTDLQASIRAEGKGTMDSAQHEFFINAHKEGQLSKPEQPGNVIADLVADNVKELSGKVLSWNSTELAKYQQ